MKRLWQIIAPRREGVLYCRVIALSQESAVSFAAKEDSWDEPGIRVEDMGEVYGDDLLIGMKQITFVPSPKCPTCGK